MELCMHCAIRKTDDYCGRCEKCNEDDINLAYKYGQADLIEKLKDELNIPDCIHPTGYNNHCWRCRVKAAIKKASDAGAKGENPIGASVCAQRPLIGRDLGGGNHRLPNETPANPAPEKPFVCQDCGEEHDYTKMVKHKDGKLTFPTTWGRVSFKPEKPKATGDAKSLREPSGSLAGLARRGKNAPRFASKKRKGD